PPRHCPTQTHAPAAAGVVPSRLQRLTSAFQKCSADFSANALFCLHPIAESAQVGLERVSMKMLHPSPAGLYEASQAVIAGLSRLQCSIASMIAHAPVWGRSSSPKAACGAPLGAGLYERPHTGDHRDHVSRA